MLALRLVSHAWYSLARDQEVTTSNAQAFALIFQFKGWKAMYITRYYFDKEGRTVNGFPFKHEVRYTILLQSDQIPTAHLSTKGGRWEELFMRYSTTKKVWHPNNAAQMGVQHFQGSKQQRCLTIQGDYLVYFLSKTPTRTSHTRSLQVSGGNSMTVDFWRLDDCTLEWNLEGHQKAVMVIRSTFHPPNNPK